MLTSNRDEGVRRETIEPKIYVEDGVKMLYPKDSIAGGTWIGVSDKNRLLCLLNGAFSNHIKKGSYVKSRGVLVKELLMVDDLVEEVRNYDLTGIEPFTLLMVDWSEEELRFFELVWDGVEAYFKSVPLEAKIWSSSTLYTDEMKQVRKEWFVDFMERKEVSQCDVFDFHENYGVGDKDVDLMIDRGSLKTVSISSFVKDTEEERMYYKDLLKSEEFEVDFNSIEVVNG